MTTSSVGSPVQQSEKDDLENFISTLKVDRLLKIVVGSGEQASTFQISESALCGSSLYFAKALKNNHPGVDAKEGILTFPSDDLQAWKVLLYWITKHTLPTLKEGPDSALQLRLVRCWLLGDKYEISAFQDTIMLNLLAEADNSDVNVRAAKEAFSGADSTSPLRHLMAQELVHSIYCTDETKPEIMDEFEGAKGVTSSMLSAVSDWIRDVGMSVEDFGVFSSRIKDGSEEWRKFMVGKGPWKHRLLESGRD